MNPSRGNFTFVAVVIAVVALCIVFPRIGAFAAMATRELRFFWWLLVIAFVIWLLSRAGRKRS